MKTTYSFLLLLLFPSIVMAQTEPDAVVADTLDWHRYYPLAVGNLWEYRVSEGVPLLRREIVGDTLAQDRRYFLMEEVSYDYDYLGGGTELEVFTRRSLFLRYDSVGAVVELEDIEADTLAIPQDVPFDGTIKGYFDLRAAFGDSIYYGAGDEDFYRTSGGYNEQVEIGNEAYEGITVKRFQSPLWWESYAADIGFLGGGNLWGPRITYANVGGIEYGVSRTDIAAQETAVPMEFAIETIFPNPSRGGATVRYHLPEPASLTVEVFDVLGQRVGMERMPMHQAGVHLYSLRTSQWAAGSYFVRITTEEGQQSVQSMMVMR